MSHLRAAGLLLALLALPGLARAVPPELLVALGGAEREATLRPGVAGALVTERFAARLRAGENEIACWVPDVPLKADSLRLLLPEGLSVVRWAEDAALTGRRWIVAAGQAATYELAVTYELPGLTWSFSYDLTWTGESASLRAWLRLANTLPQPLRFSQVSYAPLAPYPVPADQQPLTFSLPGPVSLPPRAEHAEPLGEVADMPGKLRYEFDGNQTVALLDLEAPPDRVPWLSRLPQGTVWLLSTAGEPPSLPVAVGGVPGVGNNRMTFNLGRTDEVTVTRTMLASEKAQFEFDRYGRVTGYDLVEMYRLEAANYTPGPVRLRLWENLQPAWDLLPETPPTERPTNRAAYDLDLGPAGSGTVTLGLVKHTGSRIPPPPAP